MSKRVVITGLGVVSPNGTGVSEFNRAIREGKSGLAFDERMSEYNFQCTVSAIPAYEEADIKAILPGGLYAKLQSEPIKYSCLAGTEAWKDAGLPFLANDVSPDWNTGIIFGSGTLAGDQFLGKVFEIINNGNPRRIGSRIVEQTMTSGAVTYLNKIIGFGNIATANSTACATGTEAVIMGYERIKSGKAKRMLCGSTESQGVYIWSSFEALRILCTDSNDEPEKASRPMSANSFGFIPGSGAGALVLEDLDSALERNAKIYGEIVAGEIVNGGQRNGGSITASNPEATQRAIQLCLEEANITGNDIDLICGHLTSTMGDVKEIESWTKALDRSGNDFPMINTLKSMVGHCLGASGSIELVAAALQLHHNFAHPNINIDNLHPEIVSLIDSKSIIGTAVEQDLEYVIKASLGFGDVNSCVLLKQWKQ